MKGNIEDGRCLKVWKTWEECLVGLLLRLKWVCVFFFVIYFAFFILYSNIFFTFDIVLTFSNNLFYFEGFMFWNVSFYGSCWYCCRFKCSWQFMSSKENRLGTVCVATSLYSTGRGPVSCVCVCICVWYIVCLHTRVPPLGGMKGVSVYWCMFVYVFSVMGSITMRFICN